MNSCYFLALFLKVLVCFEHRWNLKVWPCTFRKDPLSSTLYFDCLMQFSELRVPWHILTLCKPGEYLCPTPCPLSAYPPPQLLICSRHNNLNGEMKHSLSFMMLLHFSAIQWRSCNLHTTLTRRVRCSFYFISIFIAVHGTTVVLKLNWLWRNKQKVYSLIR